MTHNKNPLITTIVEEGTKKVQSGQAPFIDAEEIDLYLIGFIHGASAFALDSFTTAPGYRRLRREEEDAALAQLKEQLGIKPSFVGQVVDESEVDKVEYGDEEEKKPLLVMLKCPNEKQALVELELSYFGWQTNDLFQSRVHPETHTLLIMNTHAQTFLSEWRTHLEKMKTSKHINSWDIHDSSKDRQ